jgi:prevent-host-death family protein
MVHELYSWINPTEGFHMFRSDEESSRVVSALTARSHFGRLLERVETQNRSVVIEKRGRPKAVLLSIKDYVRLAAPEPQVLRLIGDESRRNKTDRLSSRQIDRIIRNARKGKSRRG